MQGVGPLAKGAGPLAQGVREAPDLDPQGDPRPVKTKDPCLKSCLCLTYFSGCLNECVKSASCPKVIRASNSRLKYLYSICFIVP